MAWEDIIKTVAPAVAGFFGTPLAGVATKALVDGLFEDGDGDETKLEELIKTATPETLAKIKEIEAKFKTDMANAGVKLEEIAHEDRKDARKHGKSSWMDELLTLIFVSGYFGILFCMIIYSADIGNIPDKVFGVLVTAFGVMTSAIPQILNYWFGNTKSSQDKNKFKI